MKRSKIIKKLSLAYWEVYSQKLDLDATAKELQDTVSKRTRYSMACKAKKAKHTLDGIVLSAAALGISLDELQTADNKATKRR